MAGRENQDVVLPDETNHYGNSIAFIFIFNLIVGAGALALPHSFGTSGYITGMLLTGCVSFFAFMTCTFMVEAMSITNAVVKQMDTPSNINTALTSDVISEQHIENENTSLLSLNSDPSNDANPFKITKRTEMAFMAELILPRKLVLAFYSSMIIYLYGDLCIYAVAVPVSLRSVICNAGGENDPCIGSLNRKQAYHIFLASFICIVGPFCFFNAQKTLPMQIITTFLRWSSFLMMIIIALIGISENQGFTKSDDINVTSVDDPPEPSSVNAFNLKNLPNLFGVCIYAFMCHHSIPSLITPIRNKKRITQIFMMDFAVVLCFYWLLCYTAMFRFSSIEEVYTNSFKQSFSFVSYYLGLFPVFALSTSFPIIAITLRNNLTTLLIKSGNNFNPTIIQFGLPLLVLVPPLIVAFFTEDVSMLVSYTGSYAGVSIQYIFPSLLVYYGRKKISSFKHLTNAQSCLHRTWFSSMRWMICLAVWTVACVVLVTVNHIQTRS